MSDREVKAMRVLDAIYDQEVDVAGAEDELAVVRAGDLRRRAGEMVHEGWAEYLAGLRAARAAHGAVPIQGEVTREVVLARLGALRARFPDRVVAMGHRKLAEMTDGDLRSLLADVEELLASE